MAKNARMLQLAVQSDCLDGSLPAALTRAAALALPAVAVTLPAPDQTPAARTVRAWRAQADAAGIALDVVFAPSHPTSTPSTLHSAASAVGALGARWFVTQAADLFSKQADRAQMTAYIAGETAPPVGDAFDSLWVQLANRRVRLTVRNGSGADLLTDPSHVQRVTDDLAIDWAVDVASAAETAPPAAWRDLLHTRAAVALLPADRLADDPEHWAAWLAALSDTACSRLVLVDDGRLSAETLTAARAALDPFINPLRRKAEDYL